LLLSSSRWYILPVFKRLIATWKFWQADRIARSMTRAIRVYLLRVTDENGKLNPLVPDDDFVITYIYGMTLANLIWLGKEKDFWIPALTLQQVFERLFGRGRELAERCFSLVEQHDDDYEDASKMGFSEARKMIESQGKHIAIGLIEHLKLYND
jgi:hypothetical protein